MIDILLAVMLTWSVVGILGLTFTEKPDNWWQAGARLFVAGPLCWVAFAGFLAIGKVKQVQWVLREK